MKKFYTNINQAVKLSEDDNEHCSLWTFPTTDDYANAQVFWNRYFAKYLNTLQITQETVPFETTSTTTANLIQLSDGSVIGISFTGAAGDIIFTFYPEINRINSPDFHKYRFVFVLTKEKCIVEPYVYDWDGTEDNLVNHSRYGCNRTSPLRNYCAKLMQYNTWLIRGNYPW